jgi:predicted Zn-dependent protease with MMP-like domain
MDEAEFEKIVSEAIAELPEKIRKVVANLAITVAAEPSAEQQTRVGVRRGVFLLGLYEGVPKTTWGRGFGMNLPDKITIFQKSIENFAKTEEEIKKMVGEVVWHEVAHHFGFDEEEVRNLERKRGNK